MPVRFTRKPEVPAIKMERPRLTPEDEKRLLEGGRPTNKGGD